MQAESNIRPSSSFEIEASARNVGAPCVVIFYENVEEIPAEGCEGTEERYRYDTYRLRTAYSESLENRISSNYDAWISLAKQEEQSQSKNLTDAEQIAALQNQIATLQSDNDTLTECLLEMSQLVYAG